MGERVHQKLVRLRSGICSGFFQFSENAMAHLGGGCLGEGDGDDLAGLFDLT